MINTDYNSNSNFTTENLYTASIISKCVPNLINQIQIVDNGDLRIITSTTKLVRLLKFLKHSSNLQFKALQDLFGVDLIDYTSLAYPINLNSRFQINYYLLSYLLKVRILIKVQLDELNSLESITFLYNSASWLEREVWDLFGIYFKNHPDLRRILTDYGFEGYPLRKDFPLTGYTEVVYTTELKKITLKPVELAQEYRAFDFVSPWDTRRLN